MIDEAYFKSSDKCMPKNRNVKKVLEMPKINEMATASTRVDSHLMFNGNDIEGWLQVIRIKIRAAGLGAVLSETAMKETTAAAATEDQKVKAMDILISHLLAKIVLWMKEETPIKLIKALKKRYLRNLMVKRGEALKNCNKSR